MSEEFLEPSQELKRLAEAISSLRRELQAVSLPLGRIERRLKATFPTYPAKKKATTHAKAVPATDKSTEELKEVFDSLVVATRNEREAGFDQAMSNLDAPVLLAVAVAVGAGSGNRLTVAKAKKGIRKRVQESLQLQFPPQPRKSIEGDRDLTNP